MPYAIHAGAELYFQEYGRGDALLFLHGVGGNHASWFYQITEFRRDHRVIAMDQRGFGNSTDPDRRGRTEFTQDLKAVLDAAGIDRVALVAQSLGGGACAGFTCAYPHRVRALVLADTMVGMIEPESVLAFMEQTRRKTESLSQLERVLGSEFCANNPALALLYTEICSFNKVDRRSLTGSFSPITTAQLERTGVPVLFVVGTQDALFPPRGVRALHENVAGSRYHEIAGAGHSAYFEKPAEFNATVRAFLASVGA